VVLGGLVEGVWPPETRSDPWLSRPMRLELGLDLPERRVGLSAHDFAQLLGLPRSFLTRAAKSAAPDRRLALHAAARGGRGRRHWEAALARGEKYLAWARDLDRAEASCAGDASAPEPAARRAPQALSVTEIEALAARSLHDLRTHILELRPLDAVDTPPGARDRGTVIHGAIGDFTENYARRCRRSARRAARARREAFRRLQDYPEARAFWWPRFLRIARWFVAWERARAHDTRHCTRK
jgi:ATP-dependent helicase/nuclease subunit B